MKIFSKRAISLFQHCRNNMIERLFGLCAVCVRVSCPRCSSSFIVRNFRRIIRFVCASDLNCKLFTPAAMPWEGSKWTFEQSKCVFSRFSYMYARTTHINAFHSDSVPYSQFKGWKIRSTHIDVQHILSRPEWVGRNMYDSHNLFQFPLLRWWTWEWDTPFENKNVSTYVIKYSNRSSREDERWNEYRKPCSLLSIEAKLPLLTRFILYWNSLASF